MPLPAPGAEFPPKQYRAAFAELAEYGAWYSGDVGAIRSTSGSDSASHFHDGIPHQGGIAGAFARLFWGRPLAHGEERTVLHVPIAANLATLSSDLLNSEPPLFTVAGDQDKATKDPTEDRLDLIWNSADGREAQQEAGELAAALGGTYWVADWDLNGPREYVFPRAVDADSAIPTFRGGQLTEVLFWTRYDQGKKCYRHFELHEVGAIRHALYESEDSNVVGNVVSLETLEATAPLTRLAGTIENGLEVIIPTYIDRLTAVYEPNIRKPRKQRRGPTAQWGRSDFEGVIPLFHAFDETWSSWMLDLKNGRSRLFMPTHYLESMGRGRGAVADPYREVYATIDALSTSSDSSSITAQQFAIRVDEHERTAFSIKKEILQASGYSLSSYGEHSAGQTMTATEVNDSRSDTERTRGKKISYATRARAAIASVNLELDGLVFRGKGGRPGVEIAVEWPDTSQVDVEKEVRIISLLDAASAISMETKVRRANPDWNDIQIGEEVARVQLERGMPAPDPVTFTG